MTDLKKYPLDDEELDKVTGGVDANQACNCNFYQEITSSAAPNCLNCFRYNNGNCRQLK